ncbi:MAG: RsmE family RNA methyltransferase [Gemmatimonadota bacterium]
MELPDRAGVASFVAPEGFAAQQTLTLGDDVAHHMKVRRLANGAPLRLTDGAGRVATATLVALARNAATVEVGPVTDVPPPTDVHLLAPIGDRDRMLWLAEKATELGVTSWRPVLWHRSRSVQPRGEGAGFQAKVRARMLSALAQSHGAWLPSVYPDATLDRALAALPAEANRVTLDGEGEPLTARLAAPPGPIVLALGPEGGLDAEERAKLAAHGFRAASLGPTVLRFETAGLAALAITRALTRPA